MRPGHQAGPNGRHTTHAHHTERGAEPPEDVPDPDWLMFGDEEEDDNND